MQLVDKDSIVIPIERKRLNTSGMASHVLSVLPWDASLRSRSIQHDRLKAFSRMRPSSFVLKDIGLNCGFCNGKT